MPNLFYGKINTENKYFKLSELTGIEFEEGVKYQVQIVGVAYICTKTEQPEEEGFLINDKQVWGYKPTSLPEETLWVKTPENPAFINVSS